MRVWQIARGLVRHRETVLFSKNALNLRHTVVYTDEEMLDDASLDLPFMVHIDPSLLFRFDRGYDRHMIWLR